MRPTDVEQWCARLVDRFERGLRAEDDRVEVKRQLPSGNAVDVARRIAGHANQARANEILWFIGAVEDPVPRVLGQSPGEPDAATWWTPIEARFDDVAPAPVFAHTTLDSTRSVLGIGFDTTRPPYVIRLAMDKPSREVPWREGTRIRTANRFDLLRLLAPITKQPRLSLLHAHVYARPERDRRAGAGDEDHHIGWQGSLNYYVDCAEPIIFPDHRCRASFVTASRRIELDLEPYAGGGRWVMPGQPPPAGRLAERGDGQLVMGASATVSFRIRGESGLEDLSRLRRTRKATLELNVQTAGLDPFTFSETIQLQRVPEDDSSRGMTWEELHR